MFQRTKKFFKRSIQTVKTYFSEGYQKLPKTPPYDDDDGDRFNLNNTYSEFIDQWEATERFMATTCEKKPNTLKLKNASMVSNHHKVDSRKREKDEDVSSREKEEKRCLVTRKLKELEILDKDNIDHVVDVQEVLHYYSRLTCPVYREIIEKFFTEMQSELFNLPRFDNSMPRRRPIRI